MVFFRCIGVILVVCLGHPDLRTVSAGTQEPDQEIEVEEVQVHLVANSPVVLLRIGEKSHSYFCRSHGGWFHSGGLDREKNFPVPYLMNSCFKFLVPTRSKWNGCLLR